jgi:hypothetical protein
MHHFPSLFGKELYITSTTNTSCCEYSIKTPDDEQ